MSATLLAASGDDTRLAYIHGGRLVLCDARALTELCATEAPAGARQLMFLGPPTRLLVATEDELYTYELTGLTVLGRRTVASGARVATVVDNRAVLWLPAGPSLALARFVDDAIDLEPLELGGAPLDVVPLEHQQVLVVTAQRNEVVDLVSRRVMARLHLTLPPPPRLIGQSGGLRFLWTAPLGARELTIVRVSDGRAVDLDLPAPLRAVVTAGTSSWLVVQTDEGLLRVHVVTLAAHRVDADLSRGACVGGAADAALYWIDEGLRLRRTSLAGDAVVPGSGTGLRLSYVGMDDGRPRPIAAPLGITPPGTVAVPGPLLASRAAPLALAQLEPSSPVVAPGVGDAPMFADLAPARGPAWTGGLLASDPIEVAPLTAPSPAVPAPPPPASPPVVEAAPPSARPASRLDDRVRRAGLRAARADLDDAPAAPPAPPPAVVVGASIAEPARPLPAEPALPDDDADDDARPAAAERAANPAAEVQPDEVAAGTVAGLTSDARPVRSWRMQCAAWARQLLAGRDAPEPSFAGTPLGLLARRAHLTPDGARALSLLYGAWLLGRPARPLARLARALPWDELAGRGSLPDAALHTVRGGKAAIRPTVARFLDGARARRLTVHGLRPRSNLPAGKQVVRCLTDVPLHVAAQAVADHLGAGAIIDERSARGRRQLAIAIDEAWLRSVPAVVVPGADLDATAVAAARLRADHALVVLWPDSVVPQSLEDLPILAL